jgi:cysteinyl-tRNA synthetase
MDDDLNAAGGLAPVFEMVTELNRQMDRGEISPASAASVKRFLGDVDRVFSLLPPAEEQILDAEIDALIQERQEARKRRDFAAADAIRDRLRDIGIILEDTPSGVRWKRA